MELNNRQNILKFDNFNVSLLNNINSRNMKHVNERIEAKMDLPKDVLDFQRLFDEKGYKLFVVGGAVRDFLTKKVPHDFDMVTDATPEESIKILSSYRADLQGAHFGVVRVFTEDEPEGYEIASYRKDIANGRDTKGSDKKVETGKHLTIKDDVRRRDLTINALFYDIKTGEIVDIVGGISDIENKIIRTVGEPIKRFNEDRLRLIRAIRFAAVTGSEIDPVTDRAIRKDNRLFFLEEFDEFKGVENVSVSRERIFLEFKKVKDKARKNNDPIMMKRFVDMLVDYGLMEQIFPVITKEKSIKPTSYLTIAIAQVLRDNEITSDFKEILMDAKIPGKFIDIISIIIDLHRNGINPDDVYELDKKMKNKGVRKDIIQEWVDVMGVTDKSILAFLKYEPTTTGRELQADGFRGVAIGNEMRRREADKFKDLMKESVLIGTFDDFKKKN